MACNPCPACRLVPACQSRLRKAELHRHPVDAPSRPPTNPSVTSGSSQAAQAGRTLNSVSSQGGGAVPSSDHLQDSVRPSEGPAAWAQVLGCSLGTVGPLEGRRGEKAEGQEKTEKVLFRQTAALSAPREGQSAKCRIRKFNILSKLS